MELFSPQQSFLDGTFVIYFWNRRSNTCFRKKKMKVVKFLSDSTWDNPKEVIKRKRNQTISLFLPVGWKLVDDVVIIFHFSTTFSVDPDTHIDSLEQAEMIVLEGTSKWSCKIAITGSIKQNYAKTNQY